MNTTKRRSRITHPNTSTLRSTTQAFRADPELSGFLERLPNKSEFIKFALANAISTHTPVMCPHCHNGVLFKPIRHRETREGVLQTA